MWWAFILATSFLGLGLWLIGLGFYYRNKKHKSNVYTCTNTDCPLNIDCPRNNMCTNCIEFEFCIKRTGK